MGVFNISELKEAKSNKQEVIEWCIDATNEFFDAAKEIGTQPFTRNCKYSYGSLTASQNFSKVVKDISISLFPIKVVEFYVIMLSSRFDSATLNEDYAAAIALKNGRFYFDGHDSSANEIGEAIAYYCGYIKDIAEELFKSALQGEPWDTWYANEQQQKYKDPKISIDGNDNIVGGRDVTQF